MSSTIIDSRPTIVCAEKTLRSSQSFGLLDHVLVLHGFLVEEDAAEGDLEHTLRHRRMRIAFAIAERVVLPVAGDPLHGRDARRRPQPRAHERLDNGMKLHPFVRCRTMQIERDAEIRYVAENDDIDDGNPPREGEGAESRHLHYSGPRKKSESYAAYSRMFRSG
jgi:hypothetical protein